MIRRYKFKDENTFEFSEVAAGVLEEYRLKRRKKEAGGILLGEIHVSSADVVVDVITTPNRFDRAGPYYFDRCRKVAQEIVNTAWEKSDGQQIYLGEWHSHLESYPKPSSRDRKMIRNMFHQTTMEIPFLFLVVIGWKEDWVGIEDGKHLERLRAPD